LIATFSFLSCHDHLGSRVAYIAGVHGRLNHMLKREGMDNFVNINIGCTIRNMNSGI